jgi:hypothetical protein
MKKAMILIMAMAMALATLPGCRFCEKYKANSQYLDLVQGTLHSADSVYDYLVAQKAVPDNTNEATLALAALDVAVPILKGILDGVCKDDSEVNWVTFAVNSAVAVAKFFGYTPSET